MEQAQELETDSLATSAAIGFDEIFKFLSPGAIVMLILAGCVDIAEPLIECIPYVGQVLSIIIDIVAAIFIGIWMWFRSREIAVSQKTEQMLNKAKTQTTKWAKRLKWLRPLVFFLEMIPVVNVLPCWFLAVFFEIKYNS